jgi:hypothetical protein
MKGGILPQFDKYNISVTVDKIHGSILKEYQKIIEATLHRVQHMHKHPLQISPLQ